MSRGVQMAYLSKLTCAGGQQGARSINVALTGEASPAPRLARRSWRHGDGIAAWLARLGATWWRRARRPLDGIGDERDILARKSKL